MADIGRPSTLVRLDSAQDTDDAIRVRRGLYSVPDVAPVHVRYRSCVLQRRR